MISGGTRSVISLGQLLCGPFPVHLALQITCHLRLSHAPHPVHGFK